MFKVVSFSSTQGPRWLNELSSWIAFFKALRGELWVHLNSLTSPLFIGVPVASKERVMYLCVSSSDFTSISMVLIFDFTVVAMLYIFPLFASQR